VPRLGELLVAAGVVGPAQVEEALRAQVIHGARLGTNLVELAHVELDEIAIALARLHGCPPALRRHFERCDPEVLERLPAAVAARHSVVPIGFLAGDHERIMVACRDPIDAVVTAELEAALAVRPGGVVIAVAAELRVLYFLERLYAVPRANRFLRIRRATSHPTPDHGPLSFDDSRTGRFRAVEPAPDDAEFDDNTTSGGRPFEPPDDFKIEETPVDHLIDPPPPGGSFRRPLRDLDTTPPPTEVVPQPVASPLPLDGEQLRRFVETIADAPPPAAPALGRIAIRKVSMKSGSGEVREAADVATICNAASSIDDIARSIRRAASRNRVGELAIGALRRFGDGLDACVLFVVREQVALGWKGFVRGGEEVAIDELAVPLDVPTVLAAAAHEQRAVMLEPPQATSMDRRLWIALGKPTPGQVAAAPVALSGTVVSVVYGQTAPGASIAPYAELFAAVTHATTSAFARLLRAAQR
jgi:hypothetical protein